MVESVKPFDISVVVQGAVGPYTPKCLASLRRHLPNAEVILSTWEGSDTTDLDFDTLVLSIDPGALAHDGPFLNNVNRQLASTRAGLSRATRRYVLKMRTDFYLKHAGFLRYFGRFPAVDRAHALFSERAITDTCFTRRFAPFTLLPTPFHVSDFWLFGLTNDLCMYYAAIPPMPTELVAGYVHKYPDRKPYTTQTWAYPPEQYYFFTVAKNQFPDLSFDDWSDWNEENVHRSDEILFNSFVILDWRQSGIFSDKHADNIECATRGGIPGLIGHDYFLREYKRRCDPSFRLPLRFAFSLRYPHTLKHTVEFVRQIKVVARPILKWLENLLAIPYYLMKETFTQQTTLQKERDSENE
jgi:hypothetical protein